MTVMTVMAMGMVTAVMVTEVATTATAAVADEWENESRAYTFMMCTEV